MSSSGSGPQVVVVGSSMMDLTTYSTKLPKLGETIHGNAFAVSCGGKGANQAAIAAKLGSRVLFVTRIGTDSFGRDLRENYKRIGILEDGILDTEGTPSGIAAISVDGDGNNCIVIVGGANEKLTTDEVLSFSPVIAQARVCVCQMEVPTATTLATLRYAKSQGLTTIFNPAPAPPSLEPLFYEASDIFCVNETEAETLSGVKVDSPAGAEAACAVFLSRGCAAVLITLGAGGVAVATKAAAPVVTIVPAPVVSVVDTVGAGDAFVGSLAVFLSSTPPLDLLEACKRAVFISSDSVQRKGAQPSYGSKDTLPTWLFEGVN